VPFTPAHAAAALLFRHSRLVLSAVLIGTLAPDFEYLLRFQPEGRFGHTAFGALFLSLPLALMVLWMFHTFVKHPAASLLPEAVQRRLGNQLDAFRFGGAGRFLLILASLSVGIATHILWDSFTHLDSWFPQHWAFLQQFVTLPILGRRALFRILQHFSTIVGLAALSAWFVLWYRDTPPTTRVPDGPVSGRHKTLIVSVLFSVAFLGGLGRGFSVAGIPMSPDSKKMFLGYAVVTAMALLWWELVLYGAWSSVQSVGGKAGAGSKPSRGLMNRFKVPS
jgi:Domain of unknown function (DUF4184)